MWLLAACVTAALALLLVGRRRGLGSWDFWQRKAMSFFARVWHGYSRRGPDPLPASGPAILIANHSSHADPGFLMASTSRPLGFLQARECYDAGRWLFRRAGCIPVSRGRADASAIRSALRRLEGGGVVALFPEGDVAVAGRGRVGRGRHGAALLALRSGAPVFPALILRGPQARGSLRDWLWPTRGVRVLFGPPVDLSGYRGRPIDHRLLDDVTDRLMQSIEALRPEKNRRLREPSAGAIRLPYVRERATEEK
jgi:1-acyl-sn-glycerol-3-phosphate acyltransferase